MLAKLFKYDFKWINKVMPIYYIVLVLISIMTKIIEHLLNNDPSLLLVIIDKILSSMFIGVTISVIITCLMRIWVRFNMNLYKDESYLTHTLPVTKNQLLNSKILSGIASLLMSALVITACIAFVFITKDTIESIKIMWDSLVNAYNNLFAVCFIIGTILIIALEMIYLMMIGIVGITIGNRFNNFKTLKSIIVGIGSYFLLSALSLITIISIGKIIDYDIIGNGFPSMNYIGILGVTALIIYCVYNTACYLVAMKVFNKGVNVE